MSAFHSERAMIGTAASRSWREEDAVGTPAQDISLLGLVREDLARHEGEWTQPGFQALAVHRFGRRARERRGATGALMRRAHRIAYVLVRNVYGIELPAEATIGRRLHIS